MSNRTPSSDRPSRPSRAARSAWRLQRVAPMDTTIPYPGPLAAESLPERMARLDDAVEDVPPGRRGLFAPCLPSRRRRSRR